jgi:hypothetical protein
MNRVLIDRFAPGEHKRLKTEPAAESRTLIKLLVPKAGLKMRGERRFWPRSGRVMVGRRFNAGISDAEFVGVA